MKKSIPVILALLLTATLANAAELPYIYKGVRPMGMGGAFTAVSDDANALFYNPAGLASISGMSASILPLQVEIGEKGYDMVSDASDTDFDNETETAAYLRDYVGERAHVAVNIFPYYSMPRLAVGLIGTTRMDLEVRDRQFPKVNTHAITDLGLGAGYAHPFLDDSLLVGGSLKYINRHSLSQEYTVTDITSDDFDDLVDDDLVDGDGVLLDLGIIYKFDEVDVPGLSLGLSVNNLIGNDLGDAEDLDDHVDLGIAYTHEFWILKATYAFDYMDLFSQIDDEDDYAKRLRLGAEFAFPKVLTLRAGIYQGYLTAGLSLDAKYARLDLLTYAEEIGAYAGQRTDRRYALNLVVGL